MPAKKPDPLTPDGVWRAQEWKNGRYLVVRYITLEGSPMIQQQIHSDTKFGSTAVIFENREEAVRCAEKLNEAAIEAMMAADAAATPPSPPAGENASEGESA